MGSAGWGRQRHQSSYFTVREPSTSAVYLKKHSKAFSWPMNKVETRKDSHNCGDFCSLSVCTDPANFRSVYAPWKTAVCALKGTDCCIPIMAVLHHISALLVSSQNLGGHGSFFTPRWCIEKCGLPECISSSKEAETVMVASRARPSAISISCVTVRHSMRQSIRSQQANTCVADAYVAWI